MRVLKTIRRAEYAELVALFFIQGIAAGMWLVPLTTVLDAYGLQAIKPFAYGASGAAAFVSPLIFGAMADRHVSPVVVLRGLAAAATALLMLIGAAIHLHWNRWLVLALIQVSAFSTAPLTSISSTIIFARLADAQKEFGPIRGMYTFGWMAGCWTISALNADQSVRAIYSSAVMWLAVAGFTFFLPALETPKSAERLTLRQRLGWDALSLLKNSDHRVVFITVALYSIPLAAFYPYAPPHMRALGLQHTSAWMTLGQASEMICMFTLGTLLQRRRLKWVVVAGLGFGVLRFGLSALDSRLFLLSGVFLHGASFTLVFITAQIYLDQRVDASWRARAQALMALMTSGLGNLAGYLGDGWWFGTCASAGGTRWPMFWGGLAAGVGAVLAYFLAAYRGLGPRPVKAASRAGL